ncbi:MAG: hypothetical protein ACOY5B_07590 [Spirochaetota bacterium]
MRGNRYILRFALIAGLALNSQACVGKFLSNLLSTENAQFKVLEAVPVSNTKILVGFNKPLDYTQGALTLGNYSIPGLNLVAVEKGPETNQVYLRLDPNDSVRMQRQLYTLTVSGVKNVYWDDLLPGAENRSRQFMGARWLRATCTDDAGTFTCPPSGTSMSSPVTVTVRGDYARGTRYRWALYNVTGGSYVTAGLAHSPATQSAETDINTTFIVPNTIGTGEFRLEMLIRDADGAWQPATDTSYHFFTVDNTSVNNIGLSNVPASLTSSTVTAINVVYRNCVALPDFPNGFGAPCYSAASPVSAEIPTFYKYRLGHKAGTVPGDCAGGSYTFGSWSASRATNLPIVEVLSTSQCYIVQVLAADNVGNYQCDTTGADADPGKCTNPAGPGDGSRDAFFAAKTWQETRFLLDNAAPTAAFDTNTLPPATTSSTSFAVVVDATGLDKYRYRVIGTGFSGVWSADKTPGSAGELISGAGLSTGNYTIEIIGKDAAGNYQSTSSATTYAFSVDTAAPTASLVSHANCSGGTGLPPNPTNRNCVDVQVNGVTFYKYKWVTGVTCGAGGYFDGPDPDTDADVFTAATDFITTGPAWADGQTYSLCVIGSNNGILYQGEAETAVTRYTFRYDTTPPVSQIASWINPAASLAGLSTVVDQVSVSIGKLTSTQTGTTSSGSPVVTGLTSTTGMVAGMFVSAASGISANTRILSVDSGTQITLTANATASGARSLTIASEDIQNYKGIVTTSACPTSAAMVADNGAYPITSPQSPLQATALGTGTVRICFIARDAAGNWEATTREISYTRFAPPAPADGGAANDAQYASSFNFTWTTGTGIPTGTQKISIRVCKDSACSNALPGMNNGQDICTTVGTCDATSSFALNSSCPGLSCIKQANGANYFAQLKVIDSIGQESLFGPVSNGKTVTGQVTGFVRNSFNVPISGATVGIYQNDCATQIGGNVTSAGDGSFTFSLAGGHPLPIALSASGYCVRATQGALQGTKKFIESRPGTATSAGTIYAVDTTGTPGCLIGAVVDGSTGSQLLLSNATFTVKDFNNNVVASTPSLDPDGKQFVFPSACLNSWGDSPYSVNQPVNPPTFTHANGLNPGVYTLDISIPGYYAISETVSVTTAATTNVGYLPMVGSFTAGSKQIKVILTWGNQTKDLDLHLVGPSSGIDCQPYNEAAIQNAAAGKFHISYQQRYCAETGTVAPYGSTSLAVDDSFEYGPEIINFYDGYVDGTYKLSVFNNDPTALNWDVAKARIDVYAGNHFAGGGGRIATVLSTGSSTNRGWRALRLLVSGTTLTVDDTTGVGYADLTYGGAVTRQGTRTNASPSLSVLSNTGLVTGMSVSGSGIPAGTVINAISVLNPAGRNGTLTNGNASVTALSVNTGSLAVGMTVTGTGVPVGTTIANINSTTQITLSQNATASGVQALTFSSGYTLTLSANATANGLTTLNFNFTCNGTHINGPSDGLTNGAIPAAGTTPADPNLDCGLFANGLSGVAGPLDW